MKRFVSLFVVLFAIFEYVGEVVAQPESNPLTIAYTVNENDLVPEGIAYDPLGKNFYVSST